MINLPIRFLHYVYLRIFCRIFPHCHITFLLGSVLVALVFIHMFMDEPFGWFQIHSRLCVPEGTRY